MHVYASSAAPPVSFTSGASSMMDHGPTLLRQNTAPLPRLANRPPPGIGQTMTSRASQLTGSTAVSSASTTSLTSLDSQATVRPLPNGGPVQATNNILNQKADSSRSLYQICVSLRQRLAQVPGFDVHLLDSDDEDVNDSNIDPMVSLWRCLRKGVPLMTIYNSLQPAEPLRIDEATVPEAKRPKIAAFKFVQACLKDLAIPPGECFVISDLFGEDTTGFVKVTQVINLVLDKAETNGLLLEPKEEASIPADVAGGKMSYRDHVVRELVDTERKYVQDLENLHELKKVIEEKGVITGDVIHDIFLNINAILDFQRRFLIRIETTNSQSQDKQEWGAPFSHHEDAFSIYQPFIANQRKAADIAKREFDKISLADHPVVADFNTLDGFLLKPMQRLVKYPMLLKDLRDKTGASDERKADLTAGIEAANRVLHQANAAVDRELRGEALLELCNRVDDWKNHQVDQFGELLLHGQFTVVTGKSDVEKEYTIYLFERILLCCKELNPNKTPKDKLMGGQKDKKEKKDKDKKKDKTQTKGCKLQLKGRIFMTNVTDVVSLVKPGSYTVQIWWKGDPGVENFIIRFTNEDTMKKWSTAVDQQRKNHATPSHSASNSVDGAPTDFAWMRDQAGTLPNPYAQQEDDDDEPEYPSPQTPFGSQGQSNNMYHNLPRNASSNSLRSRSTTGDSNQSLAGMVRAPPPRFPMGPQNPPLSVQTSQGPMPSPGSRNLGDSYFSPVAESPASSRTSGTPSNYFPRQTTPLGNSGWEDNNRYDPNRNTAPAMIRMPSRDSQASVNAYGRLQRPSLPGINPSAASAAAAQRSRSYSTPDINGINGGVSRRHPSGGGSAVPAVPGIPAHLHPAYDAGIPRSQNNSPSGGLPIRANTQSPGVQQNRLIQSQHGQPQFPSQYPNGPGRGTLPPITIVDPRTMSPPPPSALPTGGSDMDLPTQLKVKVNCDGNYVTLVVAFNITYQSLIDRIDAKVGRFSTNSIGRGTMRLRYKDEDGDFVTISSDDDIQMAFQEWSEAQRDNINSGILGEIALFCASVE